ncbi:hypothetical protein F8M41_010301 [Gigaspora margarita]|uniref:F-box domain-containing protein n=1 Tax=Gigaspora margarita TaxID=4874 RepID=A0A8H3X436_GIGMA|nr:hypothetical protein F8M41_010301 [Gigaspora margarita]
MHINNLPTEIFVQILEKTSFNDIGQVMRVNKKWYCESRAIVQKRADRIFEILLTTNYNTNYILIDVFHSFCINFNLDLKKKLWDLQTI